MMKIPRFLKIGGFRWQIRESKDVSVEGNCYGSTHFTSQTFFLDPTMTPQKREQTLLHEIMHAVWHQQGLAKRDDIKKFEEEIVDAVSHGLYQVIRDNPLFK